MNAAALVLPHARSSGRLREASYGPAHACAAGAVVAFLAILGRLVLPGRADTLSYDSTAATMQSKAFVVLSLYVIEMTLLVHAWRGRRPRMVVGPADSVTGLPALATFALGLGALLMIPLWLTVAAGKARGDFKEALLLGSMAAVGFVLLRLGLAHRRDGSAPRRPARPPASEAGPRRHGQAVLALPEAAFDALRDRPPRPYSFTGSRRRADLPTPPPVGFSLTRMQDGALTPPTFGILLLAAVSTFLAVPLVVSALF